MQTYVKDGVEYFSSNDIPTDKDIDTNHKQLMAVIEWERGIFDGKIGVKTIDAVVAHLKRLS